MSFDDLSRLLQSQGLTDLFFKLFAIVLAFIFVIYSIVLYRQIGVMNKTLQTKAAVLFQMITLIQLLIALAIFFIAVFIL